MMPAVPLRRRRAQAAAERLRRESGLVTVFTALAALALLLMVGLVVDGAGRMRAVSRADRVASEAARAAVEAADTRGAAVTVDRAAATATAQSYLRSAGLRGTVTVTGPRTVRVTVTVPGEDLILGVLGTGGYEVDGTAEATLTVGVDPGSAR
jgi:Flp pilus assembly protein TadG